jgi:subtilisin family serine protease
MKRYRAFAIAFLIVVFHAALPLYGYSLPRTPLPKQAAISLPSFPSELTLKFRDDLKVRALGGTLVSLVSADLGNVLAIQTQFAITFEPLIQLPQSMLDFIESQAALRSGIAQPDLGGMMVVRGPAGIIEAAAQALLPLEELEWVDFAAIPPEPPFWDPPCPDDGVCCCCAGDPSCQGSVCLGGTCACQDLCPSTPHFFDPTCRGVDPNILDYHGPNPGINMACAWNFQGGRGQNVEIADCEQEYERNHEDLCSCAVSNPSPACNVHEPAGQNFDVFVIHGSAVLGILGGRENAFGWTGLAPGAAMWFICENPAGDGPGQVLSVQNRANAITQATYYLLQDGVSGDVILLEMQTKTAVAPGLVQDAPAEIEESAYMLVLTATDAGLTVVAAAGNGGWNLDCPNCPECPGPPTSCPNLGNWRNWRDSGAIIVGAGTADVCYDRLTFSSYGNRVNVHAWGEKVFTLGGAR